MATGSTTGTTAAAGSGVITKSEIYAEIFRKLRTRGLSIGNIDDELKATLVEISQLYYFLPATTTLTTADGVAYVSLPDYYKDYQSVAISGGNILDERPYSEYQQWIEDDTAPAEAEPENFAIFNNYLWLWPVPDAVYTINLNYYKYHAPDVSAIEFDYSFRAPIVERTMAKLFEGQLAHHPNAVGYYQLHQGEYVAEMEQIIKQTDTGIHLIKYHDV